MAEGKRITLDDMELAAGTDLAPMTTLKEARESLEREILQAALKRHGGKISPAAIELGISRPLLHLHLQKLEEAGLVTSKLELSDDGKALNYFEVVKFDFELTPAVIVKAAKTITESQ